MFFSHEKAELYKYYKTDSLSEKNLSANKKFHSVGKAFCIDLSARLSVKSLLLALLTALTSAECTLSASKLNSSNLIGNCGSATRAEKQSKCNRNTCNYPFEKASLVHRTIFLKI